MGDLKEFQQKFALSLELNNEDLNDFREASDHHRECKCDICKKWHLIIRGKYKS